MFGAGFFENVKLVFTRFSQDDRSNWRREAGHEMGQNEFKKQYTKHFKDKFGFKLSDQQFCFIDNSVCEEFSPEQREKDMYK